MTHSQALFDQAVSFERRDIETEAAQLGLTVELLAEGYDDVGVYWGDQGLIQAASMAEGEQLRLLVAATVLTERNIQTRMVILHWKDGEENAAMIALQDRLWDDLVAVAEWIVSEEQVAGLKA